MLDPRFEIAVTLRSWLVYSVFVSGSWMYLKSGEITTLGCLHCAIFSLQTVFFWRRQQGRDGRDCGR